MNPRRHNYILIALWLCMGIVAPVRAQVSQSISPHGTWSTELQCSDCHSDSAWTPMSPDPVFNHSLDARFELISAHESQTCESCHVSLQFGMEEGNIRECADCHEDVHDGRLLTSCDTCHNSRAFDEIDGFSIHFDTTFPLLGAHELIACESCHDDNLGARFFGDSSTCISCHDSEFSISAIIPHEEMGLSDQCEDCHTQHMWLDAVFPEHDLLSNGFELIGAHEFAGCESCHIQPSFDLVFDAVDQNDCFACHADDYADEHEGSGFPLTCLDCHSQQSWGGRTAFNHDAPFFPIFSGEHNGAWDACVDCHEAAPIFTTFTCLTCHEHRESKMDEEHNDIRDYLYESSACLSCHPEGDE